MVYRHLKFSTKLSNKAVSKIIDDCSIRECQCGKQWSAVWESQSEIIVLFDNTRFKLTDVICWLTSANEIVKW